MDKRKIVIVGASHGGHESAIELLDKYNDVDVTVYEAGDFISFMSCGMQLYLENKVTAEDDVRNFAPEDVEKKGGHVYANHEVTAIHHLRTNVKDVYAIGDAILPLSIPAGKPMPIALATTTRREAQYVVDHIFEDKPDRAFKGVIGASALSVFDYHFATAGLNQFSAARNKIDYQTSFYEDHMRPAYVPEADNPKVYVSLTFNPYTHQILGGAVLSKYDITAQGNVLALAISHKMRLEDLAEQDFFFQPGFDRQWSLLNLSAQHALGMARF